VKNIIGPDITACCDSRQKQIAAEVSFWLESRPAICLEYIYV